MGPLTNAAAAWEAARAVFDRTSVADHASAEMAAFQAADTAKASEAARMALRAAPTRIAYDAARKVELEAREVLWRAIRAANLGF